MDRNEFIGTLRASLQGQIHDELIKEHTDYYEQYISDEIIKGRSEQEVLRELGNPRWIAKTILEASGGQKRSKEAWVYSEDEIEKPKMTFQWNSWYGKTLIWTLVILVLILVFRILGGILSLILPVALPVLLVVLIVRSFRGGR